MLMHKMCQFIKATKVAQLAGSSVRKEVDYVENL